VIQVPFGPTRRHRASVSSSGIVPSRRYSLIGFHQSTSGLGGLTTTAIFPLGPRFSVVGPAEAFGLASDISAGPFSSGRVPSVGIELPPSREALGERARISSLSRIEGLSESCMNKPEGGGSWLDPSQARTSAASLSNLRI
jgi:hypothetical protein